MTSPIDDTRPSPGTGRVILVGGGPGDPGLITRRGYQCLLDADVVVTDRLAPLELLADLPDHIEVLSVAKVPRGPSTSQEAINALLIEHARAGRTVVRLKGGDGFVFGRGAEEVLACEAAGIDVEVVPGVTSATAVPALAGIPVTHRSLTQGFTVVSAHVPPRDPRSTLDWGSVARCGTTIVLLMGVETLPEVSRALIDEGMSPDTPAACIQDGGMPSQRIVTASLVDISLAAASAGVEPPAVIVIGSVADWRNAKP